MQYAKLIDGEPELAVMPLKVGGRDVWTNDPRPYGYKELILTPAPPVEDGYVAEYDGWTETETQIVRKWAVVPLPPIEPTDVEIVMDAVAELSEVVSTTSESVNDNADAIAELSALVSEIISGGE